MLQGEVRKSFLHLLFFTYLVLHVVNKVKVPNLSHHTYFTGPGPCQVYCMDSRICKPKENGETLTYERTPKYIVK